MPDLNLAVYQRTALVYANKVKSVTSFNDKGKFDITLNHANFISLAQNKLIVVEASGAKKEILIDNAVIRVLYNLVEVYLGIQTTRPTLTST